MTFSAGLVSKILGGLGIASLGGTGIYYLNDYFRSSLTRFDIGLIDYINTQDNDISFQITSGTESTALTGFPAFDKNPIKIKVQVSTSSSNLIGSGDKEKLKKLNGEGNGNDWTWICEMNFNRDNDSTSVNDISEEEKKMVFESTDKGLFGTLKKQNDKESKKTKIEFIKKCALARTREQNKLIEKEKNLSSNEIKTPSEKIVFELSKGGSGKSWGTEESKLFFKHKEKLNYWFKN